MPKFRVRASYIATCETVIEAESQEQAYEIARELDGSEFDERLGGEDWEIDHVTEVKEA